MSFQESWNKLLCSERREHLMHDVVFIQLGLNILEGNIAKSGQADLCEGTIGDRIAPKGYETNLVC